MEGVGGKGGGMNEWIMGKGKGEKKKRGKRKGKGMMIWIMESKSADSCG